MYFINSLTGFFFQETKKLLNKVKVMFYVMVYNSKIMVFSYVFYKLSNGSFFSGNKKAINYSKSYILNMLIILIKS